MLRDSAGIGGDHASRASADRRIRKLSPDSTLSGRPELHYEAHVSAPHLAAFGRTGHPSMWLPLSACPFRGKVSVSRSTCRAACRRSDLLVVWLVSFPCRGAGVQVIMSDRVSASGSTCRGGLP
jgi:hypothetical protein